ncbi:uncharacterized protein LOC127759945 [Oryza glaberrima]|uniref:uncharacterized protein LOC127759945 n=1 Tax=Oryza glaberrima TaxID=4538 RepID=UPI00224C4DD3|nr:uncharacterized protein LOC127759945 [Oryza glaberrima]
MRKPPWLHCSLIICPPLETSRTLCTSPLRLHPKITRSEDHIDITMSSSEERMFEMDADPTSSPEASPKHHHSTCHILEGLLGRCTQVEMEIQERAMKHVMEIGEERKRSSLKRRLMMRLRKDGYDASLCRSSWVATAEHPGGDYEYIDVLVAVGHGADTSSASRLIVDVDFRSQFQLARPAPWYAHLSSRLPPVFVGPPEKLRQAVALLCMAAQRSLRESGLHVPPWRRPSYVQAKWLPCRGVQASALPPGGESAAAANGGDGPRAVVQWSVGKERRRRGGGHRRSGLSVELSDSGAGEVS